MGSLRTVRGRFEKGRGRCRWFLRDGCATGDEFLLVRTGNDEQYGLERICGLIRMAGRAERGVRRVGLIMEEAMRHVSGERNVSRCRADAGLWIRRRTPVQMRPGYDRLEGRQLLSKGGSPLAGFLSPGAAEVATAAGVLSSGAGSAYAKYTSDLRKVEQSSRVTPAQFENLQGDGAELAQSIESADVAPSEVT